MYKRLRNLLLAVFTLMAALLGASTLLSHNILETDSELTQAVQLASGQSIAVNRLAVLISQLSQPNPPYDDFTLSLFREEMEDALNEVQFNQSELVAWIDERTRYQQLKRDLRPYFGGVRDTNVQVRWLRETANLVLNELLTTESAQAELIQLHRLALVSSEVSRSYLEVKKLLEFAVQKNMDQQVLMQRSFLLVLLGVLVASWLFLMRPLFRKFTENWTTLNTQKERLDLALQTSKIGNWWISDNQLWLDERAREMLALTNQVVSWDNFWRIWSMADQLVLKEKINLLQTEGESLDINLVLHLGNGERYISLSGRAIRDTDGVINQMVGICVDNTEQKITEKVLEDNIITSELANQAKSEFLANMSHEIRTPMNAIIGLGQLLEATKLNTEQESYVHLMQASAKQLMGLLNDTLDFSKIEAQKLKLETTTFDLTELLDELSNIMVSSATEKGIDVLFHVHPDTPVKLLGDPLRLGQVLINLVSNAIKFTERGVVSIFIKPVDIAGNDVELELRVKDTGIGMTRDEQVKLFNAFSQTDGSITRKFGGTGLGLAISQHLVDLMQGQIQVASTKGQGSEFYFQIHLQLSNPLQLKNLFPKMAKEMHVALVCENPHLAENLADWLEMIGSHFRVYHDLNEYEHGVVDNCDLLLVDEQELMTGEVADVLRRQSQQGKVGIMKSVGNREKIPETLFEYVDWTLTKPITHRDLLRMYSGLATGTEVSEQIPGNLIHKQVLKGFRILAVEDNKVNQILIRKLLQKAGAEVELAENGQKALDVLKSQPQDYNLVLMDMQMPIMDGVTATIAIRSKLRLVNLPIIGLTANAMAGDRERCLNAGMNDYLTKPINQVQLFDTLSRWLQ